MLFLILALLSGVVGGLIVAAIPESRERLRNLIVILFTALGALSCWVVGISAFSGQSIMLVGHIAGFTFSLGPDPLGALFGIIASSLWMFAAVYSFGYMSEKKRHRTYFTFFLLSFSVTLGVAFSGNLIVLYLFYELLTFTTYPLVIHERTPEAVKAGKKYFLYSLSGAGAILVAVVFTYSMSGNLSFSDKPILAGSVDPRLNWLLVLFIVGFGVKAAI
ncbi:MAG: proton-conducting transporter membrane subunit, partial [Eubacteriales bacterium]